MTTRKPRTEPEQTGYRVRSDQKPLSTEGQRNLSHAWGDAEWSADFQEDCPEAPRWRPISEVPRDGRWVLLYDAAETGFYGARQGAWDMPGAMMWTPTHWMPLPPPPREDGE